MQLISRLEQATGLDTLVSAGQRVARLIRPGKIRDGLHGVWLGHPLHPVLVQASAGAWLSASILDLFGGDEQASRDLVAAGLTASAPAAIVGGDISFRLPGGANHAEEVPPLFKPGWQHLMTGSDLPEDKPVRRMLGEIP